jgi:uncharacterized protein (DUF1684 family)
MAKWFVFFILVTNCAVAQTNWTIADAENFQKNLNEEYSDPDESPLSKDDLKDFKSLDFFPINEKFVVTARFIRSENEQVFKMKTSTERLPEYIKYGELHFVLEGKDLKLNVYQNVDLIKKTGFEDYLFLPFSDLTSGKESYIGGRYIDLQIPKSSTIILDFNTAYNPYCAYNHLYSCPIVPLENDLNVAIEAGVKKFHD